MCYSVVRQPRSNFSTDVFIQNLGSNASVTPVACGLIVIKLVIPFIVAITKAKKEIILAKLNEVKASADSVVFVNFKGMSVANTTAMRRKMREEGVGYFVAKKTLLERVFGTAFEGTMPELPGEIAIAYSTDAIAPAQNVKEFALKHKDSIAIAGGIFQGVYKDKAEMTEIASIPALPVLRGMFAQLINSPRQRFAVVLSKVAETK